MTFFCIIQSYLSHNRKLFKVRIFKKDLMKSQLMIKPIIFITVHIQKNKIIVRTVSMEFVTLC